ncbi:hypothetical protein DVH07_03910 [Hafnia paralvei]|uniref:hypothetical protein n=1 Tax=Hafnia paralvei TaxID=546367 RepID=UPI000DF151A4|nr:hypothetical protein [Hafnia paralvei]RDA81020.1 hypothetical protein DVH07_03910 [Hafnia paralvei]
MKSMLKIAALLLISSSLSGCIVADHRGHHAPPPHYDWHQGSNAPIMVDTLTDILAMAGTITASAHG